MENPQISRIEILVEQQRWQEAADLTQQIIGQESENSILWFYLAESKLQLDSLEEAETAIKKALSIEPNNAYYNLNYARVLMDKGELDKAKVVLDDVISTTPNISNAWALKAHIQLVKKQFEQSLETADMALAFDPENTLAINTRSSALAKLNRTEDSFLTIEKALHDDPNNAFTHANYGWILLEKGERKKALEHFQQALTIDPTDLNAQQGMKEALKAKYPVYNLFMKYSFFMEKLTSKNQWAVIIGYIIVVRIIRIIGLNKPSLEPITTPLIYVLALVAFSTWVIAPLTNLFFRLNKFGNHLLDKNEKRNANLVAIAALGFVTGLVGLLVFHQEPFFMLGAISFGLMPIYGNTFSDLKMMRYVKYYSLLMSIVGILAVFQAFSLTLQTNVFAGIFFVGFIAQTWIINYLITKSNQY